MMDRLRLLLPLAWRNLWRNPRRTIITVLVVSVGLWSILTFSVLLKAWSVSSRDTTLKLMTGEGQIHATGYLDDPTVAHRMTQPAGKLENILSSSAVAAYTKRLRIAAIVQSEYKTLPMTLVGTDPARERRLSVLPDRVREGRYLDGPADTGIVLGRNLARRLKVIGLYAAPQQTEDQFAFTGLKTAQAFTGIGTDITEIAFVTPDSQDIADVIARMKASSPGRDIQSWKTLAPLSYAVSTFFNEFILMWLWIMFALMAIGIVNTQLMAVFERIREFGLLQALGMRPRLVLMEVTLESAMLIGVGVGLGIAMSVLSVQAFPNGIDLGFLGRGAELVGAGHILYPKVDAGDFALYSLIVWTLGVVATLWPARRASRVSPVEAMGRF